MPILLLVLLVPLAWTNPIEPEFLHLGPITIRWYGVLFAAALLAGYWHLRRQFLRAGGDVQDAERLFFVLFLGVVIGARLGHATFYQRELLYGIDWRSFWGIDWPIPRLIEIWEGGLASHGAAIGLLLGIWYGTRRIGIDFLTLSDRLSGGVALGSSFVRLGNFCNSEIVGRVTSVPWAVVFPRYAEDPFHHPRHPTQLYEFAMGIATWLLLLGLDRVYGMRTRPKGLVTFVFLGAYFTMRFFVEFTKEIQTPYEEGLPITMGQCLSIPFALTGWIGAAWVYGRAKRLPPEPKEEKHEPPKEPGRGKGKKG